MAPNTPPTTYFPLRWESTGDKWWYASPIDWAAANGHYDVVRELLRLDANHMITLTSLRRLRRLESVWDDAGDAAHFAGAAEHRSAVARRLLQDSEISGAGRNPLIGAGYGGWLLYTAASAGDLGFVKELLEREPLLVFGEGEYGLTDMMYAAARSKSAEVFWVLYDFAVSPRFEKKERDEVAGEVPRGFKWEVVNRAVHAAARGGNLGVLVELLGGGDGVLGYRDAYGSTVLHAASGRGQVEVVKHLISSYADIISSTDNEGNTALHVAAYKGHFPVISLLLNASPSSSISETNNAGNTLLHMTVAGALSPGFRRVDRQVELMKQLTTTKNNDWNIQHIINSKNNQGRTALHMAIIGSVHSNLVEHLMSAPCINVNIRDDHDLTPLDHLRQQPRSLSSEMLIRQLMSAGGMSNCQDYSARKAIASHLRMQGGMCSSPGTCFRVLDSEIFRYSGIEHVSRRGVRIRHLSCTSEISLISKMSAGDEDEKSPEKNMKHGGGAVQNAAKKLKNALHWPSHKRRASCDHEMPIPLRERFSGSVSLAKNKRTLAVRSNISSPISKKKFASGVSFDLSNVSGVSGGRFSSGSVSKTSVSSRMSMDREKWGDGGGEDVPGMMDKQGSVNKRVLMNQYLCFGGSSLSVKNPVGLHQRNASNGGHKQHVQSVACN